MARTLEFPVLLRLIDERSVAFRAAVASAPSLAVQVPTCPEWTLLDLVQHLGKGHRRWAATVTAGPADAPAETASEGAPAAPREREALLAWSAASTEQLLGALRESGPDRGCWTWWGGSQSPQTCGAVARHQLQEAAVHTYDAQIAPVHRTAARRSLSGKGLRRLGWSSDRLRHPGAQVRGRTGRKVETGLLRGRTA